MRTQITLLALLLAFTGLASNRSWANDGVVSQLCGTATGTRFNLEPRVDATSQFDPSVDFLRNQVGTYVDLVVGTTFDAKGGKYEINRDDDCAPDFEGTLPKFPGPFKGAQPLGALGTPIARTDAGRNVVFLAGVFNSFDGSGVGIFRTTAANLLNPAACPDGRHTAAQTASCLPKRILASPSWAFNTDSSSVAIDQRTSGIGAGNVYLVFRQFTDLGMYQIQLIACRNDLSVCTVPVALSTEEDVSFPEVSVRTDGRPSVTYVVRRHQIDPPNKRWDDINYVSCDPASPPKVSSCTPARLVHSEKQPLVVGAVGAPFIVFSTHPKLDHRIDVNGTETYVTWERCKVPGSFILPGNFHRGCPDVDVVMKASVNDGATWTAVACVDCGAQNQVLPNIRVDRARNIVNIAYYSSEVDGIYQKHLQVKLAQVDPGPVTPDPVTNTHLITTLATDPQADKCSHCFTSTIGVSARSGGPDGSGRAYVHFVFNNVQGTYNGIKMPDANNHLGRVDY